jgi:eukaryotic-like serine/threonine-protein kinase
VTDDVDTQAGDHLVGRLLDGRYRVGARVARGGMATVYEALDTRLDRVIALKVMHVGLGDDAEFGRRFVREARAAAQLSHPNVVAVFDQGDDDGTLFLAMEYVPGRTLRDVVRQRAPMPPVRALDLLAPVLSALSAAHDAGIVHRDIKPENVLIADDGTVKVADFGLARAVTTTGNTATQGILMGTVSYLAPELVTNGSADARSDVYSAGIVLYELLTGVKPHTGDSPIQVAYRHVHADVPAPSLLRPDIPPYVDALVQRATARDQDLRPADARVFSRQLRRVRSALEEGLPDDPELTGDLTVPLQAVRQDNGYDDGYSRSEAHYSSEPRSDTIVVPFQAAPLTPGPQDGSAPRPMRQRPRWRGLIALIAVLALALGVGTAAWYYGVHRYTTTPSLLNLSPKDAGVKAGESGLTTKLSDQVFSEKVPPGLVVDTDPGAGDRILKTGTVGLIVSKGPERYRVPQLAGLSLEAAKRAIAGTNLVTGTITEIYSETVAAGRVVGYVPKFNTVMKRGNAVNLSISKGRRPIAVRDYTGRSARDAARALHRAGFVVQRRDDFSDTVGEGRVISQTPNSGTRFAKDTIQLVVSKGPALREVPDVRRRPLAEAQQILTAAGFGVKVEQAPFHLGLNLVAGQSPGAGQRVRPGTTITVTIV